MVEGHRQRLDEGRRVTRRSLLAAGLLAASGAASGAVSVSRPRTTTSRGSVAALLPSIDEPAEPGEGALRGASEQIAAPPKPPRPNGAYDRSALYVAIYGHPGSSALGVLGERSPSGSADVARQVAAGYDGFSDRVVPCFELIASVAAADAGADGNYSNEFGYSKFAPWVETAAANGFHVVADLQSGRSRFPDQARHYEELLSQPNVSVALDPEWRGDAPFRPGGGRIGTVDASEVNETVDWLDSLIRSRGLPAKMLIIHQFTPSMITNKPSIRGTANVQIVLHMDGFGSLALKRGSWRRMLDGLPAGALVGWKNFFDEDRPTPTPAETMANEPQPSYVSYQ